MSAKGRVIGAGPYDDFIQTDASINPGNSGGPLFNLDGQVIGINTAINAAGQGIGFAVPMDMVTPFLDDLKEHGEIARGWLGVGLQRLDEDLAAGLNMNADAGVLIAEVHADQPGDKAGLLPGDVVKSINGVDVTDAKSLIRQVGKYRAGEDIEIDLLRDGKGKLLTVELGKRPSEREIRTASFESREMSPGPSHSPPHEEARPRVHVRPRRRCARERRRLRQPVRWKAPARRSHRRGQRHPHRGAE